MTVQRQFRSPDRSDEPYPADRFIPRCEDIPRSPPEGTYIVVDTLYFSTTVVELLANGAEFVHVAEHQDDALAFKRAHPEARIGGDRRAADEPTDGYDFFNSPSDVQSLDLDGVPVAMSSTNGGRAVDTLRGVDGVSVYVGGPTNAAAVARHLTGTDGPIYLVSAGTRGYIAPEDHIGATIISRHLVGEPITDRELDRFRRRIELAKGRQYKYANPIRRRDIEEYATAIDRRSVVPRLDGDRLVDVEAADGHRISRRNSAETPKR